MASHDFDFTITLIKQVYILSLITDFDQPKDIPSFGMFSDATCPPDIPKAPKKIKKKKTRPPTSPASTTSARSSRSSKSRTSFATAFEDFDQERKDYRLT